MKPNANYIHPFGMFHNSHFEYLMVSFGNYNHFLMRPHFRNSMSADTLFYHSLIGKQKWQIQINIKQPCRPLLLIRSCTAQQQKKPYPTGWTSYKRPFEQTHDCMDSFVPAVCHIRYSFVAFDDHLLSMDQTDLHRISNSFHWNCNSNISQHWLNNNEIIIIIQWNYLNRRMALNDWLWFRRKFRITFDFLQKLPNLEVKL